MIQFFYNFPKNIAKVFWGKNLLWHALAIGLTIIIVKTGLDWKWFVFFRFIPRAYLWPAIAGGMLLPVLIPFIAWGIGSLRQSARTMNTAFALGQTALLGWMTSAFYKAFTGRIPPEFPPGAILRDISHGFQLGFWRGGIFWGWPSSHTTVAFSMAVCLIVLFPRNKAVKILTLLYALYMGFAVSISIHWLSEFVAGAIFGSVVGYAVGKCFYNRGASTAMEKNLKPLAG